MPQKDLSRRFEKFFNAESWDEARNIVKSSPDLLGKEADRLIAGLMEDYREVEELVEILEEKRRLLERCRRDGIDSAFAPYLAVAAERPAPEENPADLEQLLDMLDRPESKSDPAGRIDSCRRALQLAQGEEDGRTRAWLRYELATGLLENLDEREPATVEEAIRLYEQVAAQVYPRQEPEVWAAIHNNLGYAYLNCTLGKPRRNIEKSIQYLEETLRFCRSQSLPRQRAETLHNLALAYSERMEGKRADNLEQAIQCCRKALRTSTRKTAPVQWAKVMNTLGAAYLDRVEGERAENLEQALKCFRKSLQVRRRETRPTDWAESANNMAVACIQRIRGDRAENLEQALLRLHEVLQVRTRQSRPLDWAKTLTNLGNAYEQRILGDWAENQEKAISAYGRALQVLTEDILPRHWARTLLNLGNAYHSRLRGDRQENLEAAEDCCLQAMRVFTPQAAPLQWAAAQDNLGNVYCDRVSGDRIENLRMAVEAFKRALRLRSRQSNPWEWARTQNSLATVYEELDQAGVSGFGRKAADGFKKALTVYTLDSFPKEHRRAQRNLGALHFRKGRWSAAWHAYEAALQAGERLYESGATPKSRQAELRENLDLPVRAAYCLARLGRIAAAVEVLERGKARAWAEILQRKEALLEGLPASRRRAFSKARRRIGKLEAQTRRPSLPRADFLQLSQSLSQARRELSRIIEGIRRDEPDFIAQGLGQDGLQALADRQSIPLVYLAVSLHGSLALLVRPVVDGSAVFQALFLDDFKEPDLQEMLEGEGGYLASMEAGRTESLKSSLDLLWPALRRLPAAAARELKDQDFRQAVLLPSGRLSLLPLEAAFEAGIIFTRAPSARLLQSALNKALQGRKGPPRLLGLAHSRPPGAQLPFAVWEVGQAAQSFAPGWQRLLLNREATLAAFKQALAGASCLHLACHGHFNGSEPLSSSLSLADGDLTVKELLDGGLDFSSARLAVLSACRTGLSEHRYLTEEALGFPAAFLQAGLPSVISSLWPVDDAAAALLLARFYRNWLQAGQPLCQALHSAQCWIRSATAMELDLTGHYRRIYRTAGSRSLQATAFRKMRYWGRNQDECPFKHPYYWAAFVLSGAGGDHPEKVKGAQK